jgi:protein SCO1/2
MNDENAVQTIVETAEEEQAPKALPLGNFALMSMILFLLAMAAGLAAFAVKQGRLELRPELPVLVEAPDFSLINQEGEQVDRASFKDRVWIADFIFTRCAGPCLTMSHHMSEIHKAFAGDARVMFASFSVDPDFDSPPVLAQYAERHNATDGRWQFLTGAGERIESVAIEGFKLKVGSEPPVEGMLRIFHDEHFVLIDSRGRVRGYYDGLDPEAIQRLIGDVSLLLREAPAP